MKLKQSIKLPSGTIIPAGTELHFSTEGKGFFNREEVNQLAVPYAAIEADVKEEVLSACTGIDAKTGEEFVESLKTEAGVDIADTVLADIAKSYTDGEKCKVYEIEDSKSIYIPSANAAIVYDGVNGTYTVNEVTDENHAADLLNNVTHSVANVIDSDSEQHDNKPMED